MEPNHETKKVSWGFHIFSHVFTCFHYLWDMGKLFRTHGLVSGVLTRWGCGPKQGNLPQGQLRIVGWSSKYTNNCDCFVSNYPIVIRITALLQGTIYKEVKSFHPQNHLNSVSGHIFPIREPKKSASLVQSEPGARSMYSPPPPAAAPALRHPEPGYSREVKGHLPHLVEIRWDVL